MEVMKLLFHPHGVVPRHVRCMPPPAKLREVMVLILLLPPLVTGLQVLEWWEALSPGSLWVWELESQK